MTPEKTILHPSNKHRKAYPFKELIECCPELESFVFLNKYNTLTIDFFNPEAVKALNKSLLLYFYGIKWDIPDGYLCPPIPGRADYIHYIADLLQIQTNEKIKCLDIGTGANLVYPIIGTTSYNWSFVASDIDGIAIASAQQIIDSNICLKNKIELRLQTNPKAFFKDIIKEGEKFEVTMCNPPFHESLLEAQKGTLRKLSNLKKEKITKSVLNFGGQNNELWCKGGEKKFIRGMISESKKFATNCLWFTSLVSKESNLTSIYDALQKVNAVRIETIDMRQGNKKSRLVAWTFLNPEQHKNWKTTV